jgi:hypothetical protein
MAVEKAYVSDAVLLAILKKLVPDLRHEDKTHSIDRSTMAMVVEAIQGMKNGKKS